MSNSTARPFVVIPCLNEAAAIETLLSGVLAQCPDVIVVDDGSTDDTARIVARMPVTLIRHHSRRGKGEALRSGFRAALEHGASGVLSMDGDGQHDPADIPRMLAAASRYSDSLIVGARLLNRECQPQARRRANAVADWGISWGCSRPVADTQSGMRWYPRSATELADTPTQGFVFEAAILIAASRDLDMPIVSIPIACRYDDGTRHSHFRPVGDITRIVWYTFWRVLHYGHVVRSYRASHQRPATVFDPDCRLGHRPAARPQVAAAPDTRLTP